MQAALHCKHKRLQYLRNHMLLCDQIDIMASCRLKLQHHLGKSLRRCLCTTSLMTDLEILTERAAQAAPGEEDGPAPTPAAQTGFFPLVRKIAADAGPATRLADSCLPRQAVIAAATRTAATTLETLERRTG